jgi:hypothetical protein
MSSGRDEMLGRGHIDYEAAKQMREWHLNNTGGAAQDNLTVRDYFAAQALQGLISRLYTDESEPLEQDLVGYAYEYADAMMKERAK